MVIGAQMIVLQAPDVQHGASRSSVCLPDLGLLGHNLPLLYLIPLLEWGCLLCAIVHWKYVTCFLKL